LLMRWMVSFVLSHMTALYVFVLLYDRM